MFRDKGRLFCLILDQMNASLFDMFGNCDIQHVIFTESCFDHGAMQLVEGKTPEAGSRSIWDNQPLLYLSFAIFKSKNKP